MERHWRLAAIGFAAILALALLSAILIFVSRADPQIRVELPLTAAVAAPVWEDDAVEHAKRVAVQEELPPQF